MRMLSDEDRARLRQGLLAGVEGGDVSQIPTMDVRTGGDAGGYVQPWTPEEAQAQIGPTGQFAAPVIGEAASGFFPPSGQPVNLYERGGGQSGYSGGPTLGGTVGMGGLFGGGRRGDPGWGSLMGGGSSTHAGPIGGSYTGRQSPTPYGGSSYRTLGQVGGSGYGRY